MGVFMKYNILEGKGRNKLYAGGAGRYKAEDGGISDNRKYDLSKPYHIGDYSRKSNEGVPCL